MIVYKMYLMYIIYTTYIFYMITCNYLMCSHLYFIVGVFVLWEINVCLYYFITVSAFLFFIAFPPQSLEMPYLTILFL